MNPAAPELFRHRTDPNFRRPMLLGPVSFALFATSYTPLFALIILRQVSSSRDFLHWGGTSARAVSSFVAHFGVSTVLALVSLLGVLGIVLFMRNVAADAISNGTRIVVTEVRNRNSESISYIGTYIIPFLFEDYSSVFSVAALAVLLGVVYAIYVNSTLVLINPLLTLRYSLYEVEYVEGGTIDVGSTRVKHAMLIIRERLLEDGDTVSVRSLGRKLFFAVADA